MALVDAYSHVLPPTYYDALAERSGGTHAIADLLEAIPALMDVEKRLDLIDRHDIDEQVLVPATPAVETVADRVGAAELARAANDGVAAIVDDHPDRFHGVATLPMNNPEAMLEELDRAVLELDLAGVLLYSSVDDRAAADPHLVGAGKPIDAEAFEPFYERVAELGVPIWLHPGRPKTKPDYVGEVESKYLIWQWLGWPYELSAAMARLAFSGVLARHDLTVVCHHAGAMIPLVASRMGVHYPLFEMGGEHHGGALSPPYIDEFRRFYVDTATFGSVPALAAAVEFFGPEHCCFGTDAPFDVEGGDVSIGENRRALADLDLDESAGARIREGTARALLG